MDYRNLSPLVPVPVRGVLTDATVFFAMSRGGIEDKLEVHGWAPHMSDCVF